MKRLALLASMVLAGCSINIGSSDDVEPFALSLPDADSSGLLPDWAVASVAGQCDGMNTSPTLQWSGVPAETESFLVTMVNPEELGYPHWVVTSIPAESTGLEAAGNGEIVGGIVGATFQGPGTYIGPCWTDAEYVFTVYALDFEYEGSNLTRYQSALNDIDGHVLAEASATVHIAGD